MPYDTSHRHLTPFLVLLSMFGMCVWLCGGAMTAVMVMCVVLAVLLLLCGRLFNHLHMLALGVGYGVMGAALVVTGYLHSVAVIDDQAMLPIAGIIVVLGHIITVVGVGIAGYFNTPRHTPSWQCAKCRYPLIGITEPCCPECGHPLEAKQLKNAPPGIFNFDLPDADESGP